MNKDHAALFDASRSLRLKVGKYMRRLESEHLLDWKQRKKIEDAYDLAVESALRSLIRDVENIEIKKQKLPLED